MHTQTMFKNDIKDAKRNGLKNMDVKHESASLRFEKIAALTKTIQKFEMGIEENNIFQLKDLSELGRWFFVKFATTFLEDKKTIFSNNPYKVMYYRDYEDLPYISYYKCNNWKFNGFKAIKKNPFLIMGKHFAALKWIVTSHAKTLLVENSDLNRGDKDRINQILTWQIKSFSLALLYEPFFQVYLKENRIEPIKVILFELTTIIKNLKLPLNMLAIEENIFANLDHLYQLFLINPLSSIEKTELLYFSSALDSPKNLLAIKTFYEKSHLLNRASQCDTLIKQQQKTNDAEQTEASILSAVSTIVSFFFNFGENLSEESEAAIQTFPLKKM